MVRAENFVRHRNGPQPGILAAQVPEAHRLKNAPLRLVLIRCLLVAAGLWSVSPPVAAQDADLPAADLEYSTYRFASLSALQDDASADALDSDLEADESTASANGSDPKRWKFALSPYLWMSSLSIDADLEELSGSADASFCDLLERLDLGGMLRFEAQRERLGFYVEGLFLRLTDDVRVKVDPFRVRGLGIDGEYEQVNAGFGAMYRLGSEEHAVDLMVGGRYTYLSLETSSFGPFLDIKKINDWVEPVIGARLRYQMHEKWVMSLKGEVGGFGAGTELTWGVTGLLGYRLTENITVGAGYRYYFLDYESGSLDVDAEFYGPIVGTTWHF